MCCNFSRFCLSFRIIIFENVSTVLGGVFFHFRNFFFFYVVKEIDIVGNIASPYVNNQRLGWFCKISIFSTMSVLVAPGKSHYLNLFRFDGPWLLTLFSIESPIIITFFVAPSLLNFSRETSSWLDVLISLARWR